MIHNKGFLIGKFYPPTNGHIYLITEAAKRCNELTVLVCTQLEDKENFISGPDRYNILKEYFAGYHNIKIIHHHANEPQYPAEHPRFWNIWLKIVLTYVNPQDLDVVFSSEEYGDTFAELLGITHECIDLPRTNVPICATDIRNDMYGKWDFLPQETKRKFIKKIAIMGPESVGKSTMTTRLAEYFDVPAVMEYGREYCEKVKPDLNLTDHCFKTILVRHNEDVVRTLNRTDKQLIICDTEHVTTKIFYDMYVKTPHLIDLDSIEVEEMTHRIVLYPDSTGVQDGTRKFLDERVAHMDRIVEELDRRHLPYTILKGDYEHKFNECVKIIIYQI